jgi:UrcA family protein
VTASPDQLISHVQYIDLNLATPTGEHALAGRVSSAITDLCVEAAGSNRGSTLFKPALVGCSNAAWKEARPQIARAVQRAHNVASTGTSAIQAAAIHIAIAK